MKKLLIFISLLTLASLAFGQATIPTCNSFDANNNPIYSVAGYPDQNGTTLCTDFFGKANYANSPLPLGPIDPAGFTIVDGGTGYSATPTVSIDDFYGTPNAGGAVCTANVAGGVITSLSCSNPGAGYMAPVVTVTDSTGSGASILAKLDASKVTGGLRKFVPTDTLPNIPIAVADTNTFTGSDYYVIDLVQYSQQLHADLPPTTLRGYCQEINGGCTPSYLGPLILASKNRPVRVLFKNLLPPVNGTPSGNLFIPSDMTYMGAGMGPDGKSAYTENRATLHLHGGNTPWISDGTPHQWTAPASETSTPYTRGVSTRFVPDMWFDGAGSLITSCAGQTTCSVQGATRDPGPGAMTFYWTNQQGGRLMFYHDHAYGVTRLNVYAGEAAGYLLSDPAEEDALAAATVPGTVGSTPATTDLAHIIPLVIQDKTFVPNAAQLAGEDPTWIWGTGSATLSSNGSNGDLWFPHVYTPNQNPADMGGANAFGRWDYGAWFFPPQTSLSAAADGPLGAHTAITIPCTSSAYPGALIQPTLANNYKEGCPIIPNPSGTPEGFMDTPIVNGKAYPVLHVAPAAYRFRILSAGNDRTLNLSLYLACGSGGSAAATNCTVPGATGTEVPMVPAVKGGAGTAGYVYPDQLDGRDGGVPDTSAAGPSWVEIGSEGGILPKAAVVGPTPVGFEYGRRSITVLNVSTHGLLLGPAERADAVVDFSGYAGKTLLLYNDAPAPVPAFDSRIDYYTGDPDQVQMGGAPSTLPGYGPNTRTIMQIVVDQTGPNVVPFSQTTLQAQLPSIFATSTGTLPAIVPEPTYPVASGGNSGTATYARISDNTVTFTPVGSSTPTTFNYEQKAIQELFTLDYGRMNATLGTELPLTNFQTQTTVPYGYAEWSTEIMQDGQTQLWKLTHNGVDTHFIHFHLFNVQVINRVGWDGTVKPPDTNELGWKDTVRMNPLEDIVVAIKPFAQSLPWPLPDSIRSLDVTMPDGAASPTISGLDPNSGNAMPGWNINERVNFGQEYVWHCHILGHEENDMMRPITFQVAPWAPSNLTAVSNGSGGVTVTWTDNSASESGFNLKRDEYDSLGNFVQTTNLLTNASASSPADSFGGTITYNDTNVPAGTIYYSVQAVDDFSPHSPIPGQPTPPWNPSFQTAAMTSAWVGPVPYSASPIAGISPASLNFGSVLVGTTAGPQSVTLSNTGTTALAINSIAIAGTNIGDFNLPVSSNPCGASLNPGTTCNIDVTFTPTAVGTRSATVTISSNDPVNPILNVALSGSGTANTSTAITLSAPTINYGQNGSVIVNVTSPQVTPVTGTVTLAVDAKAPVSATLVNGSATFDSTNTPALVAPTGGSHTLAANFAAQGGFGASTANGTLTVNPVALSISATPTPATMVYGGAPPTITPTFNGFVLNQGAANLTGTVTCVSGANSSSTVSGNPYSSSCSGATSTNYNITYVPGVVNVTQAPSTTAIVSNLPNPSIVGQVVTIGFKVTPQFSGVPTGSVTISANGQSCSGALVNGAGSCNIAFTTGGAKALTASYGGDTNFQGSTSTAVNQNVSSVSLSTTSLLFGNQLVGTISSAQSVTLANVGTTPLTINSITWSANFSDTNNCPGVLNPGQNCRINVRFAPTTTGVLTGSLTIVDSDVMSPHIVSLTGTGIQQAASLTPTSFNFGTVTRGQTSSTVFTLSNPGTATLGITNISLGGANANQFSRTTTCGTTLAAGASCTITVTFRPNRTGSLTATLNVRDNAPGGGLQTATLSGTGR